MQGHCDWCDQDKPTQRHYCRCGNKKAFADLCEDHASYALGGECKECSIDPWEEVTS